MAGMAAATFATPGFGQTLTTSSIHNFYPGSFPLGGTLVDRANPNIVYGATSAGGAYNGGEVYELTGAPGEKLVETVIYSFKGGPDLGAPTGRLYQDASGALYGAAVAGGTAGPNGGFRNNGGVFKLTPPPGGQGAWTETILHTFGHYHRKQGSSDYNASGLVADKFGNLYGTVFIGRGHIFQIRTDDTFHDVHDFEGPDGQGPTSPLTVGPNGVLFGVTQYGGTHPCGLYGCGTVYSLTPTGQNSKPRFATVFGFDSGAGGHGPAGPVAFDPSGAIYGTNTVTGGVYSHGTVFRVAPASTTSPARETVAFDLGGALQPFAGVAFDPAGGIYSTCFQGQSGYTDEFYLPPTAPGSYQYTTLLPLLKLRGGSFHTDGVTLTPDPASGDVVVDDTLYNGLRLNNGNGSIFRLRVKPIAAP